MVIRPLRRISFVFIFLVLLGAFIMNFNPAEHLQGGQLASTIFFILLMALILSGALWSREVVFDRKRKLMVFYSGFFGWTAFSKKRTLPLESLERVVLQEVVLIHRNRDDGPPRGGVIGHIQESIEQRRLFYKLALQVSGVHHRLEDSSSRQELEILGRGISDFLRVPLFRETI
jgi:hypothetical protein